MDFSFLDEAPVDKIIPNVFIAVAAHQFYDRFFFMGESKKDYYSVTNWLEEDFGIDLEDLIEDLPEEPGIYKCEVKFWVSSPDRDGDVDNGMKVVKAVKIYEIVLE